MSVLDVIVFYALGWCLLLLCCWVDDAHQDRRQLAERHREARVAAHAMRRRAENAEERIRVERAMEVAYGRMHKQLAAERARCEAHERRTVRDQGGQP
jgi:hypothetical protein